MKNQASFEIRAYIKGRVNLNISGSQTYNDLCQTNRTSAMSKTLVFRWRKQFQDGFTNLDDGSHPGQPRIAVNNAYITAVVGLIKRVARLTVKNIAHSVGTLSGSAQNFLTLQLKLRTVCAWCPLSLDYRTKGYSYEMVIFVKKSVKTITNLEYQNNLQLMEPGYINLSPRDAPMISSGCAKTKLGMSSKMNIKRWKKFHMPYF